MGNAPLLYADSPDNAWDTVSVLKYMNDFTEGLGIEAVIFDLNKIAAILQGMRHEGLFRDGVEAASPFKKAASFLCYFVSERPILEAFPAETIGAELAGIENHQNAMVGFAIAKSALEGSVIHRADCGDKQISKPICYSKHSYIDIIEAISAISTVTHFKIIAVFLEQLVYKTNPDCQYPH